MCQKLREDSELRGLLTAVCPVPHQPGQGSHPLSCMLRFIFKLGVLPLPLHHHLREEIGLNMIAVQTGSLC